MKELTPEQRKLVDQKTNGFGADLVATVCKQESSLSVALADCIKKLPQDEEYYNKAASALIPYLDKLHIPLA